MKYVDGMRMNHRNESCDNIKQQLHFLLLLLLNPQNRYARDMMRILWMWVCLYHILWFAVLGVVCYVCLFVMIWFYFWSASFKIGFIRFLSSAIDDLLIIQIQDMFFCSIFVQSIFNWSNEKEIELQSNRCNYTVNYFEIRLLLIVFSIFQELYGILHAHKKRHPTKSQLIVKTEMWNEERQQSESPKWNEPNRMWQMC